MASPDHDHLQAVPDELGEEAAMPGLEMFVGRYGPEAGRLACAGANMLFQAVSSDMHRPQLNAAARAELERQGVDPALVVVTDANTVMVYNTAEQATRASLEPGWNEALRILAATRRASQ
jgi:hypothetical protein